MSGPTDSAASTAAAESVAGARFAGTVGFVGVGMMGHPMASNLVRAGHRLTVHDLHRTNADSLVEAGATWASSPAEVAAVSDVTLLSLPNPADVDDVVRRPDGVLSGAKAGSAIIDLSTNSPTIVRALAAFAAEHDVTLLDAPVSGGVAGAQTGKLALMVGGDRDSFDRHLPLLEVLGDRVFYVGGPGAGSVAKLVNNMQFFHGLLGTVESLVLATKAGVDVAVLREVVRAGSGASFVFDYGSAAIAKDRLPPNFTVALAAKDAALTVALAEELGVPMPAGAHVRDLLRQYCDAGFGAEDVLGIIKALEPLAGVTVRGTANTPPRPAAS